MATDTQLKETLQSLSQFLWSTFRHLAEIPGNFLHFASTRICDIKFMPLTDVTVETFPPET